MYEEERLERATTTTKVFSEGNSNGGREVLRQQRRRWNALEGRVVPFAELKRYLDYVKELEEESGLVGIKSFVLTELKKKLSEKEVAYTFGELESLLSEELSEEVAELLEEDASAYRTLKESPFYALLRSGREPVHSSLLRSYAQSAKRLLEPSGDLEEFRRDLHQLREEVEGFLSRLEVLEREREELSKELKGILFRLEVLEREREELRTAAPEGSVVGLNEVYSLQENLSKLRELFLHLEERLSELERRPSGGASLEEFLALKDRVDALAEEVRELKELKREQFRAEEERSEEEQSVGEALAEPLAEPEPVVRQRRLPLGGNALYVAIAGLAGLIFLIAFLVR